MTLARVVLLQLMSETTPGSASCVMKSHERYADSALRARATICALTPRLRPDADSKLSESLKVSLERVTDGLSGNALHVRFSLCSGFKSIVAGKACVSFGCGARNAMSRASVVLKRLSLQERGRYEAMASRARPAGLEGLRERDCVRSAVAMYESRRLA